MSAGGNAGAPLKGVRGCRETPPAQSSLMLLTIKDVSAWLNIKPSTLYLWAAQRKIPCRRIHGLIRFEQQALQQWLNSFDNRQSHPLPSLARPSSADIDRLVEAAKRDVYTSHGETRPTASPKRKEQNEGAR